MRRSFAVLLAVVLVTPALLLAGGVMKRGKIEAQLGFRFAPNTPATARVGQSFQASIVDPAKLGAHGFVGLKRGDVVTLKITGPNDEFEILGGAGRLTKSFALNAQGIVAPRIAPPAARAPVAK